MINNHAEMTSAKETKTIVVYRPDFKVTQTISDSFGNDNKLTGFVGLESIGIQKISGVQWTIILGIGLILVLSTYYVSLDKREKKRNVQRLKDHRIISRLPKPNDASKQSGIQKANIVQKSDVANPNINIADVNARLNQANSHINNFDYENARAIYNMCMQVYAQSAFKNAKEKNDLHVMLNHLYLKLTAYRTIYVSRKHIGSGNVTLTKKDIETIDKIYRKLYAVLNNVNDEYKDDEQRFIDYMINSKKHLESLMP
jgi:hypothetical protein